MDEFIDGIIEEALEEGMPPARLISWMEEVLKSTISMRPSRMFEMGDLLVDEDRKKKIRDRYETLFRSKFRDAQARIDRYDRRQKMLARSVAES